MMTVSVDRARAIDVLAEYYSDLFNADRHRFSGNGIWYGENGLNSKKARLV
jgi:hypothetical protein